MVFLLFPRMYFTSNNEAHTRHLNVNEGNSRPGSSTCKIMDSYPVLQIVRCRLGPDTMMDGPIGYPIAMGPHSHSHFPRTNNHTHLSRNHYRHPYGTDNGDGGCCKKYVVLCCLCGGISSAVGSMFLGIHAVISANTASLMHFETVPSYIPGIMLILLGLLSMLLARRKYRYGLLMKVCAALAVVCALVCVLVTLTTTTVHMSNLQGLRECVYTTRARSCTCYGATQGRGGDTGVVFEGVPQCEIIHGLLYGSLRVLFGVSVAGILVCIFTCLLLYQLLSHEKKKMYWEQLELRCRSVYGQGGGPTVGNTEIGSCGCCNDCGGVNPWWAQTPGNLYTPNPDMAPSRWRLPWSRSRGPAPSPDSNYGFHAQSMRHANHVNDPTRESTASVPAPYGFIDSRQSTGPYSVLNTQSSVYPQNTASYSVLETSVPLWGPPPPYSDPNSPARRPQIIEPKISSTGSSSSSPMAVSSASPSQPPLPPLRLATIKRTVENFDSNEDHHVQRITQHCPNSENYENTEEISNNTDPECSGAHERASIKARRPRRVLKGVENDAYQQEVTHQIAGTKQSESELYFGDVSSCCGPDSSLYEMALDKEIAPCMEHQADDVQQKEYIQSRIGKQRLSKRSRLPLPLPPQNQTSPHHEVIMDPTDERNYTNSEEAMNSPGAFLAPDAQYEVIQQGRVGYYYTTKTEGDFRDSPGSFSFYRDAAEAEISNRDFRTKLREEDHERSISLPCAAKSEDDLSHEKHTGRREHQCCSNSATDLVADWQNVEQKLKSDDGVCPINV